MLQYNLDQTVSRNGQKGQLFKEEFPYAIANKEEVYESRIYNISAVFTLSLSRRNELFFVTNMHGYNLWIPNE